MDELRAMLKRFATDGSEALAVHPEDDEDDLFWVGVKELYHGMRSEVRLASAMQKDVAYVLLAALMKERDTDEVRRM